MKLRHHGKKCLQEKTSLPLLRLVLIMQMGSSNLIMQMGSSLNQYVGKSLG